MSLLVNQTFANQSAQLYIPVGQLEGINGVSVDNTDPEHPIISNTGTLSVSAGNGLSNVGTAQNPILQNEGILAITPGTGISVSPGQDATITNDGILTISNGAGISVSGGQDCIIDNTGILSVSAGTSISIGGTFQDPIINNPDFFRKNYEDSGRSIINRTVTTEIVVFTQNFILNANTTYIHAFSFNNFTISAVPGTNNYSVISRILPQGVGYPGVVSNLLISGANDVWSRGIMQPFTTTNATNYTYELRVVVGAGTLNLRNIQTKVFRVS